MRALGIGLLAVWVWAGQALAAGPVSGPVEIAGPGLISIEGQTIRLWGILMPGRETREGVVAYGQFTSLLEGRALSCVPTGDDGPIVSDAICRTEQGADIAQLLVREGWALDDGPRSRGYYLDEMEEAAARRRGVWGLAADGVVPLEAGAERPRLAAPVNEPQVQPETAAEPVARVPDAGQLAASAAATPKPAPPEIASAVPAPRPETAWLQVAGGRSMAQMASELGRMRATYPWLFDHRELRTIEPEVANGRFRTLIALPPGLAADTCARLTQNREACLLIALP